MRILTASIVIGPLMLTAALPAAAGQSISSDTALQLAVGGDSTADRGTYTQKAREDMQEWQRKLHDFSEKAEANGKEAGDASESDLSKAWTDAEAASDKLQAASAEDWESAKISFEKASRDLADAWDKVRPEDK